METADTETSVCLGFGCRFRSPRVSAITFWAVVSPALFLTEKARSASLAKVHVRDELAGLSYQSSSSSRTNEEAYFDHPHMSVPIRKGSFIRFTGSDQHRTVVNKGHVHLLGPFELKSFSKVTEPPPTGAPTDAPTTSPTGAPSLCPETKTKSPGRGKKDQFPSTGKRDLSTIECPTKL